MKKQVLIGMSGGVDSSVAAYLMAQAGYSCIGATMRLCRKDGQDLCGGDQDAADAQAVAQALAIPHRILDFQQVFDREVIAPFAADYEAGRTPNPCIRCNQKLKFGLLLDKALEMGCDYVASGHYAQIRQDPETGRFLLYRAADRSKDQTYFLAGLSQFQLAHIRFPLGQLTKEEVRSIAQAQGLVNARKRDSQDICFVPDGDYAAFLAAYTGKAYPEGDFLDMTGKVVGRHRGTIAYTLGQRKGLGVALGAPAYVCAKDPEKNTVTLGPNEALFSQGLLAENVVFCPFPALIQPMEVTVKIRHTQFDQPATVHPGENGTVRVLFHQPQRAVTPGQAVVLYQGELVVGGGTIAQALP